MASIEDKQFYTIRDWPRLAMEKPYGDVTSREKGIANAFALINSRVQPFEDQLLANAQSHLTSMTERNKELDDLTSQLLDMAKAADRGEPTDLKAWQTLDAKVQELIGQIDLSNGRTAKLIHDLEDPMEALADLQDRFPALRGRPLA